MKDINKELERFDNIYPATTSDIEKLGDDWVDAKDVYGKYKNLIIYGDPRGDTFIKVFKNKDEFQHGLLKHIKGYTNCDFTTSDYLYVMDGKIVQIGGLAII